MMKKRLLAALICLPGLVSAATLSPYLSGLEKRFLDDQIQFDEQQLTAVESRLENLVERRHVGANDYHFVKAQTWFDFAQQEYQENDRTGAAEQALRESLSLIAQLLAQPRYDVRGITWDTPHIEASQPVHPELWKLIARWKEHANFHCIAPETAELEVTLVHAGHEYQELGWRHALSKVQAAERLAELIPQRLNQCALVAGKTPVHKPKRQLSNAPVPVLSAETVLARYVHFAINSAELNPAARRRLDAVVVALKADPNIMLRLEGHTDQMAGAAYNLALSARRAHTVRGYLELSGVAPYRINVRALGEQVPVDRRCEAKAQAQNRRVELIYLGANNVRLDSRAVGLEIEPVNQPCTAK